MKLAEKISSYKADRPFFTFEFFPPKTDQVSCSSSHILVLRINSVIYQGFENLVARIGRLSTAKPLAVSITWGAGGSTADRSLDLAALTQEEYGIDTIMHLTCTNMEKGSIDVALRVRVYFHTIFVSLICFPRMPKSGESRIYSLFAATLLEATNLGSLQTLAFSTG
jgi:hypothetical protein